MEQRRRHANKNMNLKFKVPQLEQCAQNLKINIIEDGKKIFNKNKAGLVREIVRKIGLK